MRKTERKLFQLGDEIAAIEEAIRLAREELTYHEHLNDDTQRDAAVSESAIDRADARETSGDVDRMERHIESLEQARRALGAKQSKLLQRLGSEGSD